MCPDRHFKHSSIESIVRYSSPRLNETAFRDDVIRICQSYSIDIVIPTGTTSTDYLSKYRDIIEKKTRAKAAVESFGLLSRVTDKWSNYTLCVSAGVPTPKSVLFDYEKDAVGQTRTLRYPIVIKPRRSYASIGVNFFDNPEELNTFVREHRSSYHGGNEYIAQEKVDGTLSDVASCSQEGTVTAALTQERCVSLYDFGGGGIINKTTHEPTTLEFAKRFIAYIRWNGPLLFDFIRDREGRFYLLECNPKIWGTTELTIRAGMDIVEQMIDIFYYRKPVSTVLEYEKDLLYKWWFPEILYHLVHRPVSVRRMLIRVKNVLSRHGANRVISNLEGEKVKHIVGLILDRTKL